MSIFRHALSGSTHDGLFGHSRAARAANRILPAGTGPLATLAQVAVLRGPEWVVEVEAEAIIGAL